MASSSPRRVAIVTGGGRNIGRAIAIGFSRDATSVVVADRDISNAAAFAEDINRSGGEAVAVGVDIGDEDAVAAMTETAL
jgi:NAD(P)-dependent dehydrogenase (short-subunit alcohol dehydrogenase family)